MPVDPSSLGIVHYPAAVLKERATPLGAVTDEVRAVARRMIEVMREEEGIGLAANQVGLAWRMFVVDVPPGRKLGPEERADTEEARDAAERDLDADPPCATRGPIVFVNPRLVKFEGELVGRDEGCLSLPEITGEVRRPPIATVEALDIEGQPFALRAGGLLARCIQHENDHLDGVLIIDRMTQLSRMKNRLALRDLERSG